MKTTVLVLSCALVGCASNKTAEQPEPRMDDSSAAKPAPAADARPAAAGDDEPIAITIKKGDKRTPEAAYKGDPPVGQVFFDFKNVDLEKVALPLFSRQAGVTVEYHASSPKKLTLGFNQPVPWRDALGLVCHWTQTHAVRSQVAGRIELRDGYADPEPFLAKFDPNDKNTIELPEGAVGGAGAVTADGSAGAPAAASAGAPSADPNGQIDTSNYRDPSQDYNDKVDQLRRGVSMTNSGAK
jgi:hypothetical protein